MATLLDMDSDSVVVKISAWNPCASQPNKLHECQNQLTIAQIYTQY